MCAIANINGNNGKYDNKVNNASSRYGRNAVDNFKKYLLGYSQPQEELDRYKPSENDTVEEKIKKADALLNKIDEQNQKRSPLGFIYQYLPQKPIDRSIDSNALLGAAYEEMGAISISTSQLSQQLQEGFEEKMSAEALDINKDGQVDIAEYSTSILLADALSSEAKETNKEAIPSQSQCNNEDTTYDKLANLYEKANSTVDKIQKLNDETKDELGKIEALSKLKLDDTCVVNSTKSIDGTITNQGQNLLTPYGAEQNKDIAYKAYSYLYNYYNLAQAKDEFLSDENNLAK